MQRARATRTYCRSAAGLPLNAALRSSLRCCEGWRCSSARFRTVCSLALCYARRPSDAAPPRLLAGWRCSCARRPMRWAATRAAHAHACGSRPPRVPERRDARVGLRCGCCARACLCQRAGGLRRRKLRASAVPAGSAGPRRGGCGGRSAWPSVLPCHAAVHRSVRLWLRC